MLPSPRALIDTGTILALVDRGDRWHEACRAAFRPELLPLATSEAVLTECFHLLPAGGASILWGFLRSRAIALVPIGEDEVPELESLMKQYGDRPMDFADATLVLLARRLGIRTILTVDHNDFETYRIQGRQPFRILPERSAVNRA